MKPEITVPDGYDGIDWLPFDLEAPTVTTTESLRS
jgi:hypothetical protein